MAGGCAWSRRVGQRARSLRGLVKDTQRALDDVSNILQIEGEGEGAVGAAVQQIEARAGRGAALVVGGRSAAARARLLHALLGARLLPDPPPAGCRWLRIQYGTSKAVHLTLGNSEFELVEELECNKRPWDTLPVEDLIRQDQTDLSTMLEVELNNSFLKDGLKIIVPPDIDTDPGNENYATLKQMHSELYAKRDLILRNCNPIYLYAIDRIGKSIFSENISCSRMETSRSEEEFWTTFNLYYMTKVGRENEGVAETEKCERTNVWRGSEPSVLTSENCLDLHQIKEINANSQIFFVLFSDSMAIEEIRREVNEATEYTEDNVYRTEELPESDQGLVYDGVRRQTPEESINAAIENRRLYEEQITFMNDLLDQWDLMSSPPLKHHVKSQWTILDDVQILRTADQKALGAVGNAIQNAGETLGKHCKREDGDKKVSSRATFLNSVVKFATDCCQTYMLEHCTRLSEIHVKLLQQFILASFDMARELQVVPKKIQYVARQEQQLYETINDKFSDGDKKQELVQIMQEVLLEMRAEVNNMDWSVDDLPCHQDRRFMISNSIFYSTCSSPDRVRPTCQAPDLPSDGEEAESYDSYNFDDYEIINENDESLNEWKFRPKPPEPDTTSITSQIGAIRVENESEMFSLSRSVWGGTSVSGTSVCTSSVNISVKQASLDVQQTVLSKLSRKISLKLVKFIDCLRDSYFGTLQRCLESLESSCRHELGGRPASEAMRQLLSVARQVDLQPIASYSLLSSLLQSLKRLFHKLVPGRAESEMCCPLSAAWRRSVAQLAAEQLAAPRLARLISTQILERLSVAHERYQSALTSLESALASRLHHTEDIKLAIRKKYAPSFARLCLESTSMCDVLMYGTPELGREIGRGQYGVVYAVRGAWGGREPVAVKSVLPADERHYHELAMEFFYTRSIPPHERIVRLHGSVVTRHGHGAGAPCVLLVSDRKVRDLHAAVRAGLSFASRIRISCDIVEGIRYLHSLGLVHRDIKMKNVLLDGAGRAALSDLGFCAAEALISGSVVGTPVHMAPELLAGEYDAAVDVYAFGILFWYVCAGNIKLPAAFETFQNKEQLWSKVKQGLRPERLPHFSDACWEIMESCWQSEPSQRALLGDIEPKLSRILEQALADGDQGQEAAAEYQVSDDDSLDMTGVERNGL